jgi:glutamyl-Q tRNA(Asp) synthetase
MIATAHTSGKLVTRFAPSPTGRLHLGHAFAALVAWDMARASGGRFLLRIEDIDAARVRPEYEKAIYDDLHWLGLTWEEPVMRQSERGAAYEAAIEQLRARDLVYPCFCTRKEIEAEFRASVSAPHMSPEQGPDGPIYPGTCKHLAPQEALDRIARGEPHALRLHMDRAVQTARGPLSFTEYGAGPEGDTGAITATPEIFGDVVLARKDALASYHLAVVVDDAAQDITLVTRGNDLFPATHVHRLLQALLDLPAPDYLHHPVICDESGKRLAKRHDALSLQHLREAGETPQSIRDRFPKPVKR